MGRSLKIFLKIASIVCLTFFLRPSVSAGPFDIIFGGKCPDGYYKDDLGICLPYGPKPPSTGDLTCAGWYFNPVYQQVVIGLNTSLGALAAAGIRDSGTCSNTANVALGIINRVIPIPYSSVPSSLMDCACKNAAFGQRGSSGPPPAPARIRPQSVCLILTTPVTACDIINGPAPIGAVCGCPPTPFLGQVQPTPPWYR